jgi:thioredoxin-related protein
MKRVFLSSVLLLGIIVWSSFSISSPTLEAGKSINWISLEEAAALSEKKPKMIMVDIYATWCGYCKKMDKTTFTHPEVVKYINEHFYAVKLDAEEKNTLNFAGQEYKYIRNGKSGMNQLAMELMDGTDGMLPTIVMLDKELKIKSQIPGYQSPRDMDMLMHYFGEDYYKKVKWGIFKMNYRPRIK